MLAAFCWGKIKNITLFFWYKKRQMHYKFIQTIYCMTQYRMGASLKSFHTEKNIYFHKFQSTSVLINFPKQELLILHGQINAQSNSECVQDQ